MKKGLAILLASLVLLLQGCSHLGFSNEEGRGWFFTPWFSDDKEEVKEDIMTDDYFKTRLLETAEMVSSSLRELAEIEQAIRIKRHLEVAKASEGVKDPRLLQMVTISSLTGTEVEIESILDRLSGTAQYNFKVINKRPLVPITVSIPKGQYRLVDLIQNAGMQAGRAATVFVKEATVFVKDGVIELVYTSHQY